MACSGLAVNPACLGLGPGLGSRAQDGMDLEIGVRRPSGQEAETLA